MTSVRDGAVTVDLVVPVANDGAERDRNWQFVRAWWRASFPLFRVTEAPDPGPGEWSKGRAIRSALRPDHDGVLILADSDLIPDEAAIVQAILQLAFGTGWVIPYTTVIRLTDRCTRDLIAGRPMLPRGRRHKGPAGGGIVITTRARYETAGGIDPGFTMWGGEDISFGRALDTLVGPHYRDPAEVWHLYHRPMPRYEDRRASPANETLANRYLEAAGNRDAMRRLVAERAVPSVG